MWGNNRRQGGAGTQGSGFFLMHVATWGSIQIFRLRMGEASKHCAQGVSNRVIIGQVDF